MYDLYNHWTSMPGVIQYDAAGNQTKVDNRMFSYDGESG